MIRMLAAAALATTLAVPAAAQPIGATRLDIVATGEVTRVPDIARINAGVVTQARTASDAIRQNAAQMGRVLAALKRAGIADRDVQTSTISLNPEYRYAENQPPALTGYRASNDVTVKFRKIEETGNILDALVAEGANQINGPTLEIDQPDAALDEARQRALTVAKARAELYARSTGLRVGRIVAISEAGAVPPPMPMPVMVRAQAAADSAKIAPGEQTLAITLTVTYELQ